ncbi:hypothetical protein EVAR_81980_1 [Eumeta japonica]|uniref:ATP-dependent DNA helicase n=1 Tax=Eumeta variegata TaxID=151549 RepID=A0A4C1VVE9_EUMVA|nr:hypothetical protein EVAR_81980_1 [Eumeta japonica]
MDQVNNDLCFNEALGLIEDKIVTISGKKLSEFGTLKSQRRGELSTDLIKELSYDNVFLDTQISEIEPCLLSEQKDIYDKILKRVERGEGNLFFLMPRAEQTNFFLLNLLLEIIRRDRNVALAVFSSAIVATLLSGGRTAGPVLKLPLNLASKKPQLAISVKVAPAMPCCNNISEYE